MKIITKLTSLVVLLIVLPFDIYCQNTFQGYVRKNNGSSLNGANVTIFKDGKLFAYCSTSSNGEYKIKNIPSSEYNISVSCVGMESYKETLTINRNTEKNFILKEGSIELDSVFVSTKRPAVRTSRGHIYYLSKEAVASGDPYTALMEIPELISNKTTQSVSSQDGKSLVILVDGMRVNSGITPISPDRIESVEIVDIAGAKYMFDGGEKILNIHTKKHFPPYLFIQESARDDIPAYWQFFDSQFEIGSPKYSFGGKFYIDGGHNKRTFSDLEAQTSSYKRTESSIAKTCNRSMSYEMMFKTRLAKDMFLAFYVTGEKSKEHSTSNGNGRLSTDEYGAYTTSGKMKYKSDILSGNLYLYKKNKKSSFDATLWGTMNNSDTDNDLFQNYTNRKWYGKNYIKVKTHTFGEKFDYSFNILKAEANIGNVTTYSRYRMNDKTDIVPVYNHDRFCEYAYFGLAGTLDKINYQASAGYDFVWMKSSGIVNRYHEPRLSLSADKDITDDINIEMRYTHNINTPGISSMNPYNTSTDSLVYSSGNPYLRPSILHSTELTFSYGKNGFNSYLSGAYSYTSKTPESVAYVDDLGIYHGTIENQGHASNLNLTANASYYKKGTRISLKYSYIFDYFQGMNVKKHYSLQFLLFGKFGPIDYTLSSYYNNRIYTPISITRNRIPSVGFTASYQLFKDWQITIGMKRFGNGKTIMTTSIPGYNCKVINKENAVYPFILVRWTLRKNMKRKIDLENATFMRDQDEKIKL